MGPVKQLRNEIEKWDWLSSQKKSEVNKLLDLIELRIYDDLVSIETAAKMLDVTERQVHNLAADPDVELWKYHSNGKRKTDNRRTSTYYRVSEILLHKNGNVNGISL